MVLQGISCTLKGIILGVLNIFHKKLLGVLDDKMNWKCYTLHRFQSHSYTLAFTQNVGHEM